MHVKIKDKNIFFDRSKPKNKLELVDQILQIYAIINYDASNNLPNSERNVLSYYIKNGLNEETLRDILIDLPKYAKNDYLAQMNKKLRDKGYLVRDKYNLKKFHLTEGLEYLRQKFILEGCKTYMIGFETN